MEGAPDHKDGRMTCFKTVGAYIGDDEWACECYGAYEQEGYHNLDDLPIPALRGPPDRRCGATPCTCVSGGNPNTCHKERSTRGHEQPPHKTRIG